MGFQLGKPELHNNYYPEIINAEIKHLWSWYIDFYTEEIYT